MAQKVTYVDGAGTKFDAEICGPLANIEKSYVDDQGKTVPSKCDVVIGMMEITGSRGEKLTTPFVDLRVNFAPKGRQPRYGVVRGVPLKSDLRNVYKKDFYIPIEAPKTEKK